MLTITSDWHTGNHKRHGGPLIRGINRRGQHCLDVAQRAVQAARGPLIVAGDLIDDAGPIQPQLAAGLCRVLSRAPTRLLLGNHDMTAVGDDSLALYEEESDFVSVEVCRDIRWLNCSYMSECALGTDDACLVPFHCDIRDERVRDVPLVVAHFGVYDDSFPKWCRNDSRAWHVNSLFEFMRERNIRCVCLGDWHTRRVWTQTNAGFVEVCRPGISSVHLDTNELLIMQVGALVPTGWDNSGLHGYGTAAHWNAEVDKLRWEELPGPRFCTARTADEETALIADAARLGHKLYLRRFYEGKRPPTPEGVEAYEALPVTLEKAVLAAAIEAQYQDPQAELNRIMQEWLDQHGDDRDALEAHMRRYL